MSPEFIDAFRLPAETPVFRGPGNKQPRLLNAERRAQCRSLRAAGWSLTGLAQLYALSKTGIARMAHRSDSHSREDPFPCPTSYSVTLAQQLEETLHLIRLGCWDDPKKVLWPICKRTGERIDPRLVQMAREAKARFIAEGTWPFLD